MPIWFGYNPPFLTSNAVLPIQQDNRLIKNDLIQLLLTSYGERVMRPYIGSPIPSMQFENFLSGDIAVTRANIIDTIGTYEPRVTVSGVSIKIDQDSSLVTIIITGSVNLNPNDVFKISVGVSNGGIQFVRTV